MSQADIIAGIAENLGIEPDGYESMWHLYWDDQGIAGGFFEERMVLWLQGLLGSSETDVNSLMTAYAVTNGYDRWSSMDQFVAASFSVALTGLTSGEARIGDEAGIGYTIDPDNGTETVAWGTSSGDDTYGTGASPTDYTAGDEGRLWLTVTDAGETVTRSAPIRYAPGTAPAIADGQAWTVDDTSVSIDASASGSNLTWTYAASGLPTGVSINSGSGLISGTPTAVDSGTVTVTATDQYGRTVSDTFTFANTLRTQATAADGLGPYSFNTGSAITPVATSSDFTLNGNTLTYTIAPALPAGLSLSSAGSLTGTPTAASASTTYTVTGQDEYGRETESTFDLETVVFTVLGLVPDGATSSAYLDFTDPSVLYTDEGALADVGDPIALILDPTQGVSTLSDALGTEVWDETSSPFIIQDGTSDGAYDGAGRFTCSGGSTVSFRPEFLFTSLPTSVAGELFFAELQFTVVSGGTNLRIAYGGGVLFEVFGALSAGTYTVTRVVQSQGTAAFSVRADGQSAFDFTIDSLSLRQLGPGNHHYISTATAQPIRGQYPLTGNRRNLLADTVTADGFAFVNGGSGTVSGGVITLNMTATNEEKLRWDTVDNGVTQDMAGSVDVRATGANIGRTVRLVLKRSGGGTLRADTQDITLTGDWVRYDVGRQFGADNPQVQLIIDNQAGSGTDATSVELRRPQVEQASSVSAYQEVLGPYSYTEEGIDTISGAYFDGADDVMSSIGDIDLSGTDNITAAIAFRPDDAGINARILSTSATDPRIDLYQNSNTNLTARIAGSSSLFLNSVGSADEGLRAYAVAQADISDNTSRLRTQDGVSTSGSSLGTGNFDSTQTSIGTSAGTGNFFKGWVSAAFILETGISVDDEESLGADFANKSGAV